MHRELAGHLLVDVVPDLLRQVLDEVVPAFEALRQQGKLRFLGITAVGETSALHDVIDARVFDSAQVSYNILNPSAATALPPNYPAQDYGKLFDHTQTAGVGVVGIRVLAGGALSGSAERHPIASPPPSPIGSAKSYDGDLKRAQRLAPLVLISGAALGVLWLVPAAFTPAAIAFVTNVSGSIGDIWIAGLIWRFRHCRDVTFVDSRDSMTIHTDDPQGVVIAAGIDSLEFGGVIRRLIVRSTVAVSLMLFAAGPLGIALSVLNAPDVTIGPSRLPLVEYRTMGGQGLSIELNLPGIVADGNADPAHAGKGGVEQHGMPVFARRDDPLAQIFRRDARRFRQPRHDDLDDRVDLGIGQPHHQGEAAGADAERPPAADLQIIRLQRMAADRTRQVQRLDAAAHRQQGRVGGSLRKPQQARLRQFGDIDGAARADRHHPRFLAELIGFCTGHAADKTFLDQRAKDAQRCGFVEHGGVGDLGQPQWRILRQHAQDRAYFLDCVELFGLSQHDRRFLPAQLGNHRSTHAALPLRIALE